MKARILWVEGKRADSPPFVPSLRKKGYTIQTVGSGDEALALLSRFDPDMVVIHAASLRTSGKRISREIRKHAPRVSQVLITPPANLAANMPGVDRVVQSPVTSTKLARLIKTFLLAPADRLLWINTGGSTDSFIINDLRKKDYTIQLASVKDDLNLKLSEFHPGLVVIDSSGVGVDVKRVAKAVRLADSGSPIVLIADPEAVNAGDYAADLVLSLPFTPRKLINRIKPLLPGEGGKLLHVGPIRLDKENKRVQVQGRESTLTPRLSQLLKIFMDHPGVALERGRLFREVWNTEYTGDTRTLDVHISWLRHALEEDPRNPRFLKTIRGVGYRLDV